MRTLYESLLSDAKSQADKLDTQFMVDWIKNQPRKCMFDFSYNRIEIEGDRVSCTEFALGNINEEIPSFLKFNNIYCLNFSGYRKNDIESIKLPSINHVQILRVYEDQLPDISHLFEQIGKIDIVDFMWYGKKTKFPYFFIPSIVMSTNTITSRYERPLSNIQGLHAKGFVYNMDGNYSIYGIKQPKRVNSKCVIFDQNVFNNFVGNFFENNEVDYLLLTDSYSLHFKSTNDFSYASCYLIQNKKNKQGNYTATTKSLAVAISELSRK